MCSLPSQRGMVLAQPLKIEEAQASLADLIEDAIEGKEMYILKDDQHLVRLVSVKPPVPRAQFGSARGLVEMSDDFDAPLQDTST